MSVKSPAYRSDQAATKLMSPKEYLAINQPGAAIDSVAVQLVGHLSQSRLSEASKAKFLAVGDQLVMALNLRSKVLELPHPEVSEADAKAAVLVDSLLQPLRNDLRVTTASEQRKDDDVSKLEDFIAGKDYLKVINRAIVIFFEMASKEGAAAGVDSANQLSKVNVLGHQLWEAYQGQIAELQGEGAPELVASDKSAMTAILDLVKSNNKDPVVAEATFALTIESGLHG